MSWVGRRSGGIKDLNTSSEDLCVFPRILKCITWQAFCWWFVTFLRFGASRPFWKEQARFADQKNGTQTSGRWNLTYFMPCQRVGFHERLIENSGFRFLRFLLFPVSLVSGFTGFGRSVCRSVGRLLLTLNRHEWGRQRVWWVNSGTVRIDVFKPFFLGRNQTETGAICNRTCGGLTKPARGVYENRK